MAPQKSPELAAAVVAVHHRLAVSILSMNQTQDQSHSETTEF